MGIVGIDTEFKILDDDRIKPYLDAIEGDTRAPNAGQDDRKGDDDDDQQPRPPGEPNVNVLMAQKLDT